MKILVTGTNGLVGQKIIRQLAAMPDVLAISSSRGKNISFRADNVLFEMLDITQESQIAAAFEKHRPDVVVNAAGMTQPDACQSSRSTCWRINVEAVRKLAEAAHKHGAHLVQMSTDFVFDGTRPPYAEADLPNPVNYYGTCNWEAEKLLHESLEAYSIVRTVQVFGYEQQLSRTNLMMLVVNNLRQGKPVRLVKDQFRTPTLAEDLAWAVARLALRRSRGVFHVSGQEYLSIYEFGILVAKAFYLDTNLVHPVSSLELNQSALRPPRTAFDLSKASAELGFRPTPLADALAMVRQQMPLG